MKRLVILLCLLALSVSALAVVGCGGNGDAADDPAKVVQEFMKASIAGDADAVYEMLSALSKTAITDKEELVDDWSFLANYRVGSATIVGDRATVPTTFFFEEMGEEIEFSFDMVLVNEGGVWKVSLLETEASMDEAYERMFEDFMDWDMDDWDVDDWDVDDWDMDDWDMDDWDIEE